jgi:N-acetylneuraminic acid mutarotase
MVRRSKMSRFAVSGMACAFLAACGGGGSSGSSPVAATYDVSATAGTGGTVSPTSAMVNAGGTTTFTMTATAGYTIGGVTGCGGTLSGNTYTTGPINANCTVTASFVAQYAVTATAGNGGSVSPSSATVNAGGTTVFTVTPNSGYAINGVTGCGGTLSGNTYTTGPISANCTVTASFVAQYAVTATAGNGGTISPASAMVNAGGTTRFTVTPNSGYTISGVTGCGGTLSGNTYITGVINAACTVTASFVQQFTVTGVAGVGGTITPATATIDLDGATSFTVSTDSGYVLDNVTGCGGGLSGNTYTTGSITANCAVTAIFSGTPVWVSGSDTAGATGLYGTQGMASLTNVPGARETGVGWTDAAGNLWLFGGYGYGAGGAESELNDLWQYSPASGEWTWYSGSSTAGQKGVYGTQNVAAATNIPGARASGATWKDASGNLWMFGGTGYDSAGHLGGLNDMWMYSPASGDWTWLGGSDTTNSPAVYGTQGVPGAANVPRGRSDSASWTDANGNFWVFGGFDPAASLNDLWMYSPTLREWTWVGGSSGINVSGVYGTQGVAAASNLPGGRYDPVSWKDANGNLWLFGGYGYDSTGAYNFLNDLWEYSPSSGEWTWVGGSNTVQANGVYGTRDVAAPANVPGARGDAVSWTDAAGNLWLFGGYGYDSAGAVSLLSDLWEFSPGTGEWTWVGGPDVVNQNGVYGTQGVAAATNMAGAREVPTGWADANGNLWLFGGKGYDSAGTLGDMNDLWKYPAQ